MDNGARPEMVTVTQEDIPALAGIMKRSFDKDCLMHTGKPGGPPGYDTGDFLRTWCFHDAATAFKIMVDGAVAGAVILFINDGTRVNTLGCLFLEPDLRQKGLGAEIWRHIERKYPETRKWKTETIWYSTYNHYFYVAKCGFQIVRIDNPKANDEAQYHMEKSMETGHEKMV